MELKVNKGSDKSWVYTTFADFSEEVDGRHETFAIRLGSVEKATEFKQKFEEIQKTLP
jgi:Ran-binding protein 1